MNVRAGIIVTGTEVLAGRITDRNGPWVASRLRSLGVDVAHITICGDRPADLIAQLRFLADERVDLIVTTGGLGPTADDLTVATVAEFCGRPLYLDTDLEEHVTGIIRRWQRFAGAEHLPPDIIVGITKQAMVPQGAQSIPPTGTAPGVAIPAVAGQAPVPAVLILPGPPYELRRMWPAALSTGPVTAALAGRAEVREETIRAYGLYEAKLAETLREAQASITGFDELEITTCLRHGELEIVSRFDAAAGPAYAELAALLDERHGRVIFATDGATIDDVVAQRLAGRWVATAESCTGGLVAGRLTDRAGSSDYVAGGVVSYSNDVKIDALGVPAELIEEHGAVSEPVAAAMADGVCRHLGVDVGISTSGIAGPGGGTPDKPVGTVCFGLAVAGRPTVTMTRRFPGDRTAVRDLSVTAAMHLMRGIDPR